MSLMALSIIEKIKDLNRPWATAAAIITSFLLSTLSQNHPDLSLINAWGYNTIADTHFCNNIRYFCNFKLYISIITARDSGAEIYRYSDINLTIKVGK